MTNTRMNTDRQALGRAIHSLRKQAGLTQKEIAGRAGMDHTYVSRVESGSIDPGWSTLRRFLIALGVDLRKFADALTEAERRELEP